MKVKITFSEVENFVCKFGELYVAHDYDWYEGDYDFTPGWDTQVYPTAGKGMKKDLTIREIEVNEVSNPSGGLTLSI